MQKYILKNLDCANCALKIEDSLKKQNFVKHVMINFASSTMDIDTTNISKVIKVMKTIEPEVQVTSDDNKSSINIPKNILYLCFLFLLFSSGIIFEKQLNNIYNGIFILIIFISVYILSGYKVIKTAIINVFHRNIFNEYLLMTIATLGAFLINAPAEASGVMLFFKVGQFLEDVSVDKSRRSIKALLEIRPDYANLKTSTGYKKVDPSEVKPGEIILVKPGERAPLDGKIISGSSIIDASAITGESFPLHLYEGDELTSGMISVSGSLLVEVTKIYSESSIYRILNLVENALNKKAKTEKFISIFSKYYTPAVVFAALFIAFIPPFLFNAGQLKEWIYRALVILVISCPCALVISIPLGFFRGIGLASKNGILIKGSNYIDALNKLKIIIFDKTGTLTKGKFKVNEINLRNNFSREDVLKYAAYAESHSSHPIAHAIKAEYNSFINESEIISHKEYAGYGVEADLLGKKIIVSNDKFLHEKNIPHMDCNINKTAVYVVIDNVYAGNIILGDAIKADSLSALTELKKLGIKKTIMLTGDNKNTAEYISNELKLDEYYSELKPLEKVEHIEQTIKDNPKTIIGFVGDGINDAPSIARADVGFAMGSFGSDSAIETADVVLMTDSIKKIPIAIRISKITKNIVIQNIVLALAVKSAFLVLGSAGISGMWEAVFADVGVTILAILNTFRIKIN